MAQSHPVPSVEGIVSAIREQDLEVEDPVWEMLADVVTGAGDAEELRQDDEAMANLGVLVSEVTRTAQEDGTRVVNVELMQRTFLRICPLPPWCR